MISQRRPNHGQNFSYKYKRNSILHFYSFWVTCKIPLVLEQLWAEGDGECRQPLFKSCSGHKKRRPFGLLFFGARNRTSSIIRYFTLLADIVCINPFRNKPDITTMTNNSSKIWPNHDQPIHNLIIHIPQQFFCCRLHLVERQPPLAEAFQWSADMIDHVVMHS